jgi:hypothetical protein
MYKTLYVWMNPLIPDLIKVGITKDDIERRLTRRTDFPEPIELKMTCICIDAHLLEKMIKDKFHIYRYKNKFEHFTEFYRIECYNNLIIFAQEQCKQINESARIKKKKGVSVSSSFSLARLNRGDKLKCKIKFPNDNHTFVDDIFISDVRNNKVLYNDHNYSLVELFKVLHKANSVSVPYSFNAWAHYYKEDDETKSLRAICIENGIE